MKNEEKVREELKQRGETIRREERELATHSSYEVWKLELLTQRVTELERQMRLVTHKSDWQRYGG